MTATGTTGTMATVLAVLLSGCASPDSAARPAGVAELGVTPAAAGPGDEVMLTLENRSEGELGYNLCPAVLERRENGEWEERPESPAEVCTMELRMLGPGNTSSFRHTLPTGLPAGTYRFRTTVEAPLGVDRVEVVSAPFEVTP
jgi:hypothetical protein